MALGNYVGSYLTFVKKFEEVRTSAIRDIVAVGIDRDEAKEIVEHNLIGMRQSSSMYRRKVLQASPDAVRLMELTERVELRPKQDGWQSALELHQTYRGQRFRILNKLKELRNQLVNDLNNAGFNRNDAESVVEHNLIGMQSPKKGGPFLYASPTAIAILDDMGGLAKKVR